jgi:hypothetical protein
VADPDPHLDPNPDQHQDPNLDFKNKRTNSNTSDAPGGITVAHLSVRSGAPNP